ncbi:MAG: ParB N-terminal domain-containing protein [Desulfurococcaceae archaeon]
MSKIAYEIKTPKIVLKISIEEVNKLHIHEEIIPSILKQLVEKIRKDNVFKDPIIVDEKTLVVLDGMHRVAASKELGLKYIPVCLIDYDNPNVGLYTWVRVVKYKKTMTRDQESLRKEILDVINRRGYRQVYIPSMDAGHEMLSRRELVSLLVLGRSYIGIRSRTHDIKLIYDELKNIEEAIIHRGFSIEYHTEKDALELVNTGEAISAIIPPVIRKDEVREISLRGEVFIHKATRHVIPARPMGINLPLEYLTSKYTINEALDRLLSILSNRALKVLPPGSILDRRYDEELYVFE